MKFDKKTIINIVIIVLIALVAIFIMLNLLVKDSDQQTKTEESKTLIDQNFKPEIQGEIQKIIPGVSNVIKEGQVVTPSGKPVKNDALPGSPEAPQQSDLIKNLEELPIGTIKLAITTKGFSPLSFEIKSKQVVNLAITSSDANFHVFKFKDPSLSGVSMGIPGEQTRAITFNAPEKTGEYEFFCDVPGHEDRGEKGKMIVK